MRWHWIDRFVEFHSGHYAKAIKVVSLAEDHLHDHLPGLPMMPNTLVIEGMAQTGGLLVHDLNQFTKRVVLAKIVKAEFYCFAMPGDTLAYTATLESVNENGAMVGATSHIGDRLQAELELMFGYMNDGTVDSSWYDPRMVLRSMHTLRAYEVGVAADGSPLRPPPPGWEMENLPLNGQAAVEGS